MDGNCAEGEGKHSPLIVSILDDAHLSSHDHESMLLLPFSQPMRDMPLLFMVSTAGRLYRDALMIASFTIGPMVFLGVNMMLINRLGRPDLQACLGLVNSYYWIAFLAINISVLEKFGIEVSVSYGSRLHDRCKRLMHQAVLTSVMVYVVVTVTMYWTSGWVMVSMGISSDDAYRCQSILRKMVVVCFFEMGSNILRTFCVGQGEEEYLGKSGLVNMLVSCVCSYVFIAVFGLGLDGFLWGKSIYEALNLASCVYIYGMTDERTRGRVPLAEVLDGFWGFCGESVKFGLGSYSEVIGFEISTVYVAHSQDNIQISAYASQINLSSFFYTFGLSLSIIVRTRINTIIGMGKPHTAKNVFIFYYISCILLGAAVSIVIRLIKPFILSTYSGENEEIRSCLGGLIGVYQYLLPCELSFFTSSIGMKTIGLINQQIVLNSIVLSILNITIGYVVMVTDGRATSIFLTLVVLLWCCNLSMMFITVRYRWERLVIPSETKVDNAIEMSNNSVAVGGGK